MSKKKIILIITAIFLLVALGYGAKALLDLKAYKAEIASMEIGEINLADVPDGAYEGSYDAGLVRVRLLVSVADHRITGIDLLEHENGKGGPAEALIPEVLDAQSLDVDIVAGATSSSKVILKSIELALDEASADGGN
jgi:uncharacterized protein with FMN-binding domain